MNNKKMKIILVLGGTLFSLLTLEIGMRVTGYLMITAREAPLGGQKREAFHFSKDGAEKVRIMALGDSTTNGGTLPLQDTFPFLLFDLIQNSEFKDQVTVANHGRCEYNSSMTLEQVKSELDDFSPNIVLLLTGEADRFNPKGMEKDFIDSNPKKVLESFLLNFRVYKLMRGIAVNLKFKYLSKEDSMYSSGDFEQDEKNITHMLKAFKLANEGKLSQAKSNLDKVSPPIPNHLYPNLKGELFNEFGPILEYPQVNQLSFLIREQKYEEAVEKSLYYLVSHPYHFFNKERDGVIYNMFWSLDFQSKYKPKDLLSKLSTIPSLYPGVGDLSSFKELKTKLENYHEIIKAVDSRRESNVEEIIKILKGKGIEVVVMNYPANFSEANKTLEIKAKKHNLKFVDLRSAFVKLMEKDGRSEWLLDDEHPTVKGNKEISKIIFSEIQPIIKKASQRRP